jgi:hypothetical protein
MDAHTGASRSRRKLSQARKRAWVSEFAATTVLLFAEVLLIRLVFDPNAPLTRALPGVPRG